jgi:Annexin
LERRIAIELTGNLDTLAKWVLKGAEEEFDPRIHTDAKMEQDAEKLRSMGEGRIGTNESGIFKLLCTSPPKYLQGVNSKYEQKYGHDLVKTIQREFSGQLETATLFLLRMKLDPYEQVARMIHDACKGIGTNELLLTSYLIRYQKLMKEANAAHNRMYKKSVQNLVKFETSGDFEKLLVEVVDAA